MIRWKPVFTKATARRSSRRLKSEPRRLRFSERFECKYDGTVYAQPEPRLFSFNNPFGACPTCQGFGNTIGLDLDLVIPNPLLTFERRRGRALDEAAVRMGADRAAPLLQAGANSLDVPFSELPEAEQRAIIEGKGQLGGVRGFFDWLETKKYKLHVRVFLAKYRGYTLCPDCDGGRLRQEARDVRVGGRTLPEVCALSIKDAATFLRHA